MKPLTERMTKGGAAKTWVTEVEAKDREIERLEQIKTQYLFTIDLLAREKEQLKDALDLCRMHVQEFMDCDVDEHIAQLETEIAKLKWGIRNAMNNLGVPNAGYPSPVAEAWAILAALLTKQEQPDET